MQSTEMFKFQVGDFVVISPNQNIYSPQRMKRYSNKIYRIKNVERLFLTVNDIHGENYIFSPGIMCLLVPENKVVYDYYGNPIWPYSESNSAVLNSP